MNMKEAGSGFSGEGDEQEADDRRDHAARETAAAARAATLAPSRGPRPEKPDIASPEQSDEALP